MSAVADVLPGVRRVEQIMGMPIVIDVRDGDVDEAALDHVYAWFRWVDATFSTYREDSEISRLARGELAPADACGEVRYVLDRCEQAAHRSAAQIRRDRDRLRDDPGE